MTNRARLGVPAVVLAADHRARGIVTVESYDQYLGALRKALPHCDGVLASRQPLADLVAQGAVTAGQLTYLSLNRTGLAGSTFELDDRPVASVGRAAVEGFHGIKHMVRIDLADERTAAALELLGRVLEEAAGAGLEAMVEAVPWRHGRMGHETDDVVLAAVVAHDMGAPLLKVPTPAAPAGARRVEAVRRVVASVGVPVLFLGGPRRPGAEGELLAEVVDVMAGGGAGMAVGRSVYQDPDPAEMARRIAAVVRGAAAEGG